MNKLLSLVLLIFLYNIIIAQDNVGIGTATPNPKSILDLKTNDKGLLIPRMSNAERLAINPSGTNDRGLLVYSTDDELFYYWDSNQWVAFPQSGSDNISLTYDSASGTLTLIDDAGILTTNINSTDRDEQELILDNTTNELSITNGNTVDLSSYVNTDNQDLLAATLTGNTLEIDIENGASVSVDLSPLLGTDEQTLNLNGTSNELSISNGNTVDLSPYVNTDNQDLLAATLTGNTLEIDIENGASVTVDLSSLIGTDNQDLTAATLTNDNLQIDIQNGNSVNVDLSPLKDHDWYEQGTTTAPTDINQNIYTQGNVGIGQATPISTLHLTAPALQLRLENPNGTTFSLNSTNAGDFRLLNFTSGTTFPFTVIGTNDYIGIGTTAPNYRLHLDDQTGAGFGAPGIQLTNSITGNGLNDGVRLATNGTDFWVDNRSNGNLLFATNATEQVRITGNGLVGINLTNPTNRLDLNGNMAIGGFAGINNAPNNGLIVSGNTRIGVPNAATLVPTQTDNNVIRLDVSGGYTRIGNYNSDPGSGVNPGSSWAGGVGALGVGMNRSAGTSNVDFWNTTAQGQTAANNDPDRGFDWRRFNQLGNEQLLMNLNGLGDLTITGTNYLTSDKRLKSNIKPMPANILEKVMLLNPSTYGKTNSALQDGQNLFYGTNENTIEDFGFIAQEVYEVFPELVYKPENDQKELWAVDYARLSVMLTKALQEQQAIIQELKNENSILQSSAAQTEQKLENLNAEVQLLKEYITQSAKK